MQAQYLNNIVNFSKTKFTDGNFEADSPEALYFMPDPFDRSLVTGIYRLAMLELLNGLESQLTQNPGFDYSQDFPFLY